MNNYQFGSVVNEFLNVFGIGNKKWVHLIALSYPAT